MGMQYADGTGLSLQLWVILGEGFEGLPTTTDHQVIKCTLMLPSQRTQFFGQGEGQQKILGRHLFFELPFQPLLAFVVLAMGTVTMTAGMRNENLFFAAVALRHHHRALGGAALFQGGQHFAVAGQQRVLISHQEFGFKGLDDRREQHHLTLCQSMAKPFINVLMSWSACWFVVSVRWV
jgi:hypothetical protein